MSWLHVGDLHASEEDDWLSVRTLARIVEDVNREVPAGALDFVFLPGDNANHGQRAQYARVAEVLDRLPWPRHAIPGDHDFEPGTLALFHQFLAAEPLPVSIHVGGRRALFLDIVSAGSGGPDFRLGATQTAWLREELRQSRVLAEPRPIVFMHAFPADLVPEERSLARLFADFEVAFVDTGHTHYNEVLNDGTVIYSATRSTGQIEEDDGAAGFAIAAVDGDAASWRFKRLDAPWPFVLVTTPADARMTVRTGPSEGASSFTVRALVLGAQVASVRVRIDDDPAQPMVPLDGRAGRWTARIARERNTVRRIVVEAIDRSGRRATDGIRLGDGPGVRNVPLGHHAASIGAWPEHGILGSRLGPNANGKGW